MLDIRTDWEGHDAARRAGYAVDLRRHPFVETIVHHAIVPDLPATASPQRERDGMRAIHRYHVDQDYGAFGYQFAIAPSGRVWEGRGWDRTGAHTKGRNSPVTKGGHGLGICLLMDGDKRVVSLAAFGSLVELVEASEIGYGVPFLVPGSPIVGHRLYAKKSCPGDRIPDTTLRLVRSAVNSMRAGR